MFERTPKAIEEFLQQQNLDSEVYKVMRDRGFFKNIKNHARDFYQKRRVFFGLFKSNRFKVRQIKLDNIVAFSNFAISEAIFDYCCHPKYGDGILAIKNGTKLYIHHKLCSRIESDMANGVDMVFVQWLENQKYNYKILVALEDKKGAIARFLTTLAKYQCRVIRVNYDRMNNEFASLCEVYIQSIDNDIKPLKNAIEQQYKIIEFSALKDAYS